MSEDLRQRIAQIYVKWNRIEITGDDAVLQIKSLLERECDKAWLTDQRMKAK